MNTNDETRCAILYYKSMGLYPKTIAKMLQLDEKYVFNVMMTAEFKRIFKNGSEET